MTTTPTPNTAEAVAIQEPVVVEGELLQDVNILSAVGRLIPWWARAVIYLLTLVITAVWGVAESNTSLHWGWSAGYAGWVALSSAVAAANTTRG